jgi:signal recognition particle subunit SRP54
VFESLTRKLQEVFQKLARKGYLTEADVDSALREVRLALLEADVHYQVVKDFLARVRERAVGAEVMKSLTPAQQVVKIVYEELIKVLGEGEKLNLAGKPPHVIMLVGLQGSGKTTTAAKLALKLRKEGHTPLLVAADTRRPAAVIQLEVLGRQLDIPVYKGEPSLLSPQICVNALNKARADYNTVVILDTAGRLHIDDELMRELEEVKRATSPAETLLVADAMTGQDAVRVAQEFHKRLGLTGLILTKLDGDARGGAAISMRAVTGVPIKFVGVGEKPQALEEFHPDRLASRILGMGDVLTLIEKAQEVMDQEKALKASEKMLRGEFTLEDFLVQIKELKKLGPISQLLELIPGFSSLAREIPLELTDRQLKRVEAIINSMTPEERRHPEIINASRKRRIAKGSGTTVQEVNELLVQFRQVQKMMKEVQRGRLPGFLRFLS